MCTPVLLLVCFLVLWAPNPKTERIFCFCLDIKHRIPANENVLHTEKLCCSKITQDSSLQHLREFPESPEECWACTLGPCETFPKSKIGVRLLLRKEAGGALGENRPHGLHCTQMPGILERFSKLPDHLNHDFAFHKWIKLLFKFM